MQHCLGELLCQAIVNDRDLRHEYAVSDGDVPAGRLEGLDKLFWQVRSGPRGEAGGCLDKLFWQVRSGPRGEAGGSGQAVLAGKMSPRGGWRMSGQLLFWQVRCPRGEAGGSGQAVLAGKIRSSRGGWRMSEPGRTRLVSLNVLPAIRLNFGISGGEGFRVWLDDSDAVSMIGCRVGHFAEKTSAPPPAAGAAATTTGPSGLTDANCRCSPWSFANAMGVRSLATRGLTFCRTATDFTALGAFCSFAIVAVPDAREQIQVRPPTHRLGDQEFHALQGSRNVHPRSADPPCFERTVNCALADSDVNCARGGSRSQNSPPTRPWPSHPKAIDCATANRMENFFMALPYAGTKMLDS